ncbi:DUF4440 domain-containing protein [Longibacter salinarum]|uniref:DUF4440 domain-containing protein n=2 Tax=Longibacter salinarum TaxID=1850348 RepID=A0A2A8CXE6_9BACT|nr:DUF4440 domain-containing protein [Longibacter salinarum]
MLCSLISVSTAFSQEADSSATNQHASITLPPEFDRVLRDYEQAWRNHDAQALAVLFTEDGFVLRPGHPPVRGREAIEEAYRESGGRLHLRALSYEESGSVAYIVGGYTSTPKWPDAGKFILTLERGPDGRWLIAADMDNGNR